MLLKAADFACSACIPVTPRPGIVKFGNKVPKIILIITRNSQSTLSGGKTIAASLKLGYADIDKTTGYFLEQLVMNLSDYFENVKGLGILATADEDGMVDLAIYAKPHVIDETTVAFIMRERLTRKNLKSNPKAAYMFVEQGEGYTGKRLYLTKMREESNTSVVEMFRKKQPEICSSKDDSNKYLVHFQIDDIRPLVGDST